LSQQTRIGTISSKPSRSEDVDGRDKPGHDG
jgi:hypothetical protein